MLDTIYKIVMIPLMVVWLIEILCVMIEKIKEKHEKKCRKDDKK